MLVLGVLLAALGAAPADETGPKTVYRPEMFETLVNPDCSHCVDEARTQGRGPTGRRPGARLDSRQV